MAGDKEDEMVDEEDEFIEDVDEKVMDEDEISKKMDEGNLEEDVYSEEGRGKEVEDDEIAPWEEGFAMGAEAGGKGAKCRYCGKIIIEKDDVFERKVDGKLCFFCSEDHAEKYIEKAKKGKKKG